MKAVILAAGVSSRMRPLTNNTPKCLLNMGSQTILERMINNLIQNGLNDFIIVTGFLNTMIEDFIKRTFKKINVTFLHNHLYGSTNNIYSLWMVKNEVANEDMILLDSDIVFDKKIIQMLLDSEYNNCLALKSVDELDIEEIKIKTASDNSISEISKIVDPLSAIGESIGIEKFSAGFVKELFKLLDKRILEQKHVNIFYEAAFQDAIDLNHKIYPVDVGGLPCMEIDTIEDYEIARTQIVPLLDS